MKAIYNFLEKDNKVIDYIGYALSPVLIILLFI